jgi:hypothetical protein
MALSADRNTPRRDGVQFEYPCAASKTFYVGAIVVLDSSGNAEPATAATGKIGVGVCQEALVSTTAAAEKVKVRSGVFRLVNGESITKAHIGDAAYANDDQTIYRTATGRSQVGTIVDVDSEGVWVAFAAPLAAVSTGLLAANNLSDLASADTARTNLGLADSSADLDLDTVTSRQKLVAGGAAYTVGSAADGDSVITTATDNAVITLPDAAAGNAGKRITVINTGADGAALISVAPHASDAIFGSVPNAAADSVSSGTVNKPFNNTKATANKGDFVTLVSDGSTGWYIVGGVGIWASTP